MLEKDRKKRLGQRGDVDEVLKHPFFANLDMKKLLAKEIEAPFIPKIDQALDLSNFDSKILTMSTTESILPSEGIDKINA